MGARSSAASGPRGAWAVALGPEPRAALRDELRRRLGAGDAPFRLTAPRVDRDRVGTGPVTGS